MPELPDVEAFKRYFDATSLHKRIDSVKVRDARLLETSARKVHEALLGSEFDETRRWGKHLFAHATGGEWLALHFGMTGDLKEYEDADRRPDHVALEIGFEDDSKLVMTSRRRLGKIDVTNSLEQYAQDAGLGPDALEMGKDAFIETMSGKRSSIKGALMDQSILAGVGNIYADEILYQAKVHPETHAEDLGKDVLGEVWRLMRHVLRTASDHAPNREEMPRGWLIRTRERGASCPRCSGTIEKLIVVGRPTYVCPSCQQAR